MYNTMVLHIDLSPFNILFHFNEFDDNKVYMSGFVTRGLQFSCMTMLLLILDAIPMKRQVRASKDSGE